MLWLVNGTHKSIKAWWFVLVKPMKINSFKLALGSDSIDLSEYGDIIECGYGDAPSQSDIDFVKEKGFKLNEEAIAG